MKYTKLFLLVVLFLAACAAPATQTPTAILELTSTATLMPIPTLTQTIAPTPPATSTATLDVTATTEVKNYSVCKVDDYKKCPIPVDDLFNGEYWRFLKTLSKPFDSSKFKNPMPRMVFDSDGRIYYDNKTAPNFPNSEMAPFRRAVTAGIVSIENGKEYGFQYDHLEWLVLANEYADKDEPNNKDKNIWVIGVKNLFAWIPVGKKGAGSPATPEQINTIILRWKNLKVIPIVTDYIVVGTSYNKTLPGISNPLTKMTFDNYGEQSMKERFEKFMQGDASGLDGLVVSVEPIGWQYPAGR